MYTSHLVSEIATTIQHYDLNRGSLRTKCCALVSHMVRSTGIKTENEVEMSEVEGVEETILNL